VSKREKANWVLKNRPPASNVASNSEGLTPQPALVPVAASATRRTSWLTRWASDDTVDGPDSIASESGGVKISYIVIQRYLRPALTQHAPAKLVLFHEGYGLEARRFRRNIEGPDTREQAEHAQRPLLLHG
jgi:hypothetical protein